MTTKADFAEIDALKSILESLDAFDDPQKKFILKTVIDRLQIDLGAGSTAGAPASNGGPAASSGTPSGTSNTPPAGSISPKDFLKQKNPKTDVQRIACLGYYLATHRGVHHFKTLDISKLNTEAHCTKLSNAALAVANATKQNQFLAPAGKGAKQMTTLGEDVVEALPNQEKVAEVVKSGRKPRKKQHLRKK